MTISWPQFAKKVKEVGEISFTQALKVASALRKDFIYTPEKLTKDIIHSKLKSLSPPKSKSKSHSKHSKHRSKHRQMGGESDAPSGTPCTLRCTLRYRASSTCERHEWW